MQSAAEVVVVGGGAAGVCCAYELAQRGREVVLLERDVLCSGSSYGNAAFVAPSRSFPLSAPGVIGKSLRWLLERDGHFRLRPRPDPDLARWLLAFRRCCTDEAAHRSAVVVRDLVRESLERLEAYSAGVEFGFRRAGLLDLYRSPEGEAYAGALAKKLAGIGVVTQRLTPAEVRERVPIVDSEVRGGLYCAEDAHVDPPAFVRALAAEAVRSGVRIEAGTEVVRLERHGDRVTGVETSRGRIDAGTIVLANGAWAAVTGRELGLRFLIEPGKGYSLQLEGFDGEQPDLPLLLLERLTTLTPLGAGARVTAKLDLAGFDGSARGRRVRAIPDALSLYLRVPEHVRVTETWAGFRPLPPDGLPLVGRAPGISNLVLSIGGGRMGLALAPAMGRLVAGIVAGDDDHPHLASLAPARFGTGS